MRRAARNALRRLFPKMMHKRALSHDEWSELEEDLLPVVVDPARAAIDVGAYVGSYTVRLARLATKVFAFEPDEEMADLLRRAAPPNVVVSSDALSDSAGWATFRVPVQAGKRSVTLGSLAPLEFGSSVERQVRTTTLDALADENVGFIKIDVEGHEVAVLSGARAVLRKSHPVLLLEANDAEDVARLEEFFAGQDYAGFFVHPDGGTRLIGELTPDLQDRAELSRTVSRREMRFVNNFFYAPSGDVDQLRQQIESVRPGDPGH